MGVNVTEGFFSRLKRLEATAVYLKTDQLDNLLLKRLSLLEALVL